LKSIYGAAIVHIYDVCTDLIIQISWGYMAIRKLSGEYDYDNVNMPSLWIPSITLIFIYRIAYAQKYHHVFKNTVFYSKYDILLIMLDVYIFKIVYQSFMAKYTSPSHLQKLLHFFESVFESMPQLVLQSIFLIRTYGTELEDHSLNIPIYFILGSIALSLFSITAKFRFEDSQWVADIASSTHCTHKRCPCISPWYLMVVLWRVCDLMSRFSIFTLLWAVVGGFYLGIYLGLSLMIYLLLARCTSLLVLTADGGQWNDHQTVMFMMHILKYLVGTPLRPKSSMMIIRFIENAVVLTLITLFAVHGTECPFCNKVDELLPIENPYVQCILIAAMVMAAAQPLTFGVMTWNEILRKEQEIQDTIAFSMGLYSLTERERMDASCHPMIGLHLMRSHRLKALSSPMLPALSEGSERLSI